MDAKRRVPIRESDDGVRRIGGTRVTLDSVVATFDAGATPEEIAQQFPSLRLADIYSVIGVYLDDPQDVLEYLEQRRIKRKDVQVEAERRFDPDGVRGRLVRRRVDAQAQ